MRAFVGIPVPAQSLPGLAGARAEIVVGSPIWAGEKWVPPENLHLTLKFLGNVDAGTIDRISSELLERINSASFSMPVVAVKAVPSPRRATMLWAVFDDLEGRCRALRDVTESITSRMGIAPDQRPFSPHVTLVRSRHTNSIAPDVLDASERSIRPMSVLHVTVCHSTLTNRGARYENLAQIPLGTD
ncbi:MAG: RNA 2',3'-cyclic phosphodiesterase [Actinomycetota bacterium]|jgi:2'-5' RNA ligase|nr:RNA 2',3'-cyclic phosphodiesterase [Actinomycetota bacterium]